MWLWIFGFSLVLIGIDFVLGLFEMLIWRLPLEVYTFRWRTWDWLKVYTDFCKILISLVFLGLFVYWDCIEVLIGSYPYGFCFIFLLSCARIFWHFNEVVCCFLLDYDSNVCGFEWLPSLHLKFIVLRLLRLRSFEFCFKQCVKENLLRSASLSTYMIEWDPLRVLFLQWAIHEMTTALLYSSVIQVTGLFPNVLNGVFLWCFLYGYCFNVRVSWLKNCFFLSVFFNKSVEFLGHKDDLLPL